MSETEKKSNLMSMKEVAYMATQIGFSVSITTVLFVGGGKYLDDRLGKAPLFTLLGIAIGLIASLYLVWQIVKPLLKKHKTDFKVLKKQEEKSDK